MKDKRILVISNDFTTIWHFRSELMQRLVEDGYDVTVALPNDERNVRLSDIGCRIEDLSLSRFGTNPITDLKTLMSILRIIRKIKPQMVLTYTAKPNIYGGIAARLKRIPYVANVTGLGSNFQKKSVIGSIMLSLQRIAYKKADTVFFQNQSNLEFFKNKKVVRSNCELLPGSGVNLQENPFEEYPEHQILKYVTIARIRRDKGYDELFELIRRVSENNIPAEFHVVGWYEDDSYRDVVEEMMRDHGVIFHENMPHDQVHALITSCDCLIQPSHHEGMSNVVLETAATGRPCIVSDIPGCREGVENEVTGYCFTVKDSRDLYDKFVRMNGLSYEERAAMGKAARKKMEKEFDRNIVIEKYIEKIKKAVMGN